MKETRLALIGFTSGFISSALGIGGGVILVPCLIILMRENVKKAVSISLMVIAPTVTVGLISHLLLGAQNLKIYIALTALYGAIFGAKLGAKLVQMINTQLLKYLFALLMLFAALKQSGLIETSTMDMDSLKFYIPALVFMGFLAGLLSSMLGIGGGLVIVPSLNLIFGLSMHEAIATSLLIIIPTASMGAYFHSKVRKLKNHYLNYLVPAALVGAFSGASISVYLPAELLKQLFSIIMLLAGLRMILDFKIKETSNMKKIYYKIEAWAHR